MAIKAIKGEARQVAGRRLEKMSAGVGATRRREGYARETAQDRAHFLNIARGSCAELETQLYIAEEAGLIDAKQASKLRDGSEEVSRMLYALRERIRHV